jgi:hypothetical protein
MILRGGLIQQGGDLIALFGQGNHQFLGFTVLIFLPPEQRLYLKVAQLYVI